MSSAHISILMATRNVAHDLPDALHSVASFAPESPFFIWDGQSTDGTLDLLSQYQGQITRWESGADQGIYDALSKTLAWVETPFVYILGADDRLLKDWSRMAATVSDPYTVTYGDVRLRGAGHTYRGAFSGLDLARTNICQQAVIYPAEVLRQHPFVADYQLQADWELHMWIQAQPWLSLRYENVCICDFNDLSGASSLRYDAAFNRDYPQLLKKYFGPAAFLRFGLIAGLAHNSRKWRGKS